MSHAAEILLYIASGCIILLTLVAVLIAAFLGKAVYDAYAMVQKLRREFGRMRALERYFERSGRLASRWLTYFPARLFEAWGERDYY